MFAKRSSSCQTASAPFLASPRLAGGFGRWGMVVSSELVTHRRAAGGGCPTEAVSQGCHDARRPQDMPHPRPVQGHWMRTHQRLGGAWVDGRARPHGQTVITAAESVWDLAPMSSHRRASASAWPSSIRSQHSAARVPLVFVLSGWKSDRGLPPGPASGLEQHYIAPGGISG